MPVRRLPVTLALACLVAVLAALLAGCGGTVAAGPDLSSFSSAADASSSSSTGRFELKLEQSLPGTDKTFGFSASGGFDTASKRAHLVFDMSAFAQLLTGLGEAFGGKASGDLPKDPDAWKLEAIQDGTTVYVHFPLLAKQLPAGKSWVKGDAKELASSSGSSLGQFGSLAGADPRDTFSYLRAVSGSIETVGGEEIRGTATTHYRASIDPVRLGKLVPATQKSAFGSFDQMLSRSGLTEIPLDVWLDGDQRVRRLELAFELDPTGSGQKARTAMTMELYGYGEPLDLTLPPPEQVVDASTLKRP